mgnify:FL=1
MLALKLGFSLGSPRPMGAWQPSDESSLVAWYKNKTGVFLSGSNVVIWEDSSSNNHAMTQATASEQPTYDDSTGTLTFDSSNTQNLQSQVNQISLTGEFVVGFYARPDAFNNVILGDNTTTNEFFKYSNSDRFQIKIDGTLKTFSLNTGGWTDYNYVVITRDSDDLIRFYVDGTLQTDTETLAGTSDIDAIGVRATDVNPYDGTLKEVQIYSSYSEDLINNVNSYLSGL